MNERSHHGFSSGRAGLTASAVIHRRLRDDIVSMIRLPGEAISEKEIALQQGVSRTPVREALLRLAEENLVDIAPKSGTHVARIPIAALADAFCARDALERTMARKAASNARASAVANMRAIIERQRECVEHGDTAGFHQADDALHRAIADAAGHVGVWDMVRTIKLQLDRYRRLTLPQPGRLERVITEHCAVVDAIADRDPPRAVASMHMHINRLEANLGEIRNMNPDYFVGDIADIQFDQALRTSAIG